MHCYYPYVGGALAIGSKQDENSNQGYIYNQSQNWILNQKTENAENQLTIDFSDSNSFDLFKKTQEGSNHSLSIHVKRLNSSDQLKELLEYCKNVISLDLSGNKLSKDDVQNIASSENLSNLEVLSLQGGRGLGSSGPIVTLDELKILAQSTGFGKLRSLNLNYNFLSNEGISILVESGNFENLAILDLAGNKINSEGVSTIATYFKNLTDLNLAANNIGDEGVRILAESNVFSGLNSLRLEVNKISNIGAQYIMDSGKLNPDVKLDLFDDEISPEMLQAIKQKYRNFVDINEIFDDF